MASAGASGGGSIFHDMLLRKWNVGKVDTCLSKAIRWTVVVSLGVHLLLLVKNSSKSTGGWLDAIASAQYLEDFPTISSWTDLSSLLLVNTTGNSTEEEPLQEQQSSFSINAGGNSSNNASTIPLSLFDVHAPWKTHRIPLEELVNSNPNVTCVPGNSNKRLIESTIVPENITYSSNRKIPKIVHVTSKTRCMTPKFIDNIDQWRFDDYALYFHDDVAVDRLLAKYWPEFPHLQLYQKCSVSGAAKADIWRLLVLWEYGGIYTDIDNAPGGWFNGGKCIKDDDDAWFVVERIGVLSQYFMAASPRHPLIFVALTHLFQRLLEVENIRKQYVPFTTGPGVMKTAMMLFMKDKENFKSVSSGKYTGLAGRTVTVEGVKGKAYRYVKRESVSGIHKRGGYAAMGMQHFGHKDNVSPLDSCYEHLFKQVNADLNLQRLQAAEWQSTG